MMKFYAILFFPIFLIATEFSVASYNVENLFDAKKSGHEYKEYIPNTQNGWNERMVSIKIKNIVKVIKDIDADIISLQEVENKNILKRLNLALGSKKYPYMYSDFKNRGIDSVLLSRYPIIAHKSYNINYRFRPIHQVVINIKGLHVNLFLNHWPSYKNGNKIRIQYAKKLESLCKKVPNYILLGDFNSPLVEDKNGWGKSVNYINKNSYNLWYDLPKQERYSHVFYKSRNALDHIIISKNIQYKEGSFEVFKRNYLLNKYKHPKRWEITNKGKGKHLGIGYSDHLAIHAIFDTNTIKEAKLVKTNVKNLLVSKKKRVNCLLEDVMVIDSNKFGVLVEDKNRDTIYIYKPDCNLHIGRIYSLHVKELGTYKGKNEIVLLDFNSCLDKISN